MSKDTPIFKVNFNGKDVEAECGETIIEVADRHGVTIPRFCYHKKLSIAANCRMCLVELEGGRKPMPACATPVTDGMIVHTKSKNALGYQKSVMEFLLINHPLDCPICDQGGECELQDNAMAYGKDVSRYNQGKHTVADKDIGPLIQTDFTRCIHCTRCVRFGVEVAGENELGMTGRGEHSEISTFIEGSVDNELSGNMIDLCPVGALTNKDFLYKARAWEMTQKPTIAAHDCVGSNVFVHERRGQAMRVVPRENEAVNEVWISDRDRYSVAALRSDERLTSPMIKREGEWETVDWADAFEHIVTKLNKITKEHGDEEVGMLVSPNCTTEEAYLAQKLMRGFGCHNIDHRLRFEDTSHQDGVGVFPSLNCSVEAITESDVVFFFGGNARKDHPLIHQRLRYTSRFGGKVIVMNPANFDFKMKRNNERYLCEISALPERLAAITAALAKKLKKYSSLDAGLKTLLDQAEIDDDAKDIADKLAEAKNPSILSGLLVRQHPQAGLILGLQDEMMKLIDAKGGRLTDGANTAGCYLAGAIPHRGAAAADIGKGGKTAVKMLREGMKSYFLAGVEPECDSAFGDQAFRNLKDAEFVVSMNAFGSESMKQYSDVILPITTNFETSGTFVNVAGIHQTFQGTCRAPENVKPLWKVLRVMANFLHIAGFEYNSTDDVRAELMSQMEHAKPKAKTYKFPAKLPKAAKKLTGCGIAPIYRADALVRRSAPLQATRDGQEAEYAWISHARADKLNVINGDVVTLTQNGQTATVKVLVKEMPDNTIIIPMGVKATQNIVNVFGQISIAKG